jgi:hypothetical protein
LGVAATEAAVMGKKGKEEEEGMEEEGKEEEAGTGEEKRCRTEKGLPKVNKWEM